MALPREICSTEGYTDSIFPTALNDMRETHTYIESVHKACEDCCSGSVSSEAVLETRQYVEESLQALVTNVQCLTGHITQFLILQVSIIVKPTPSFQWESLRVYRVIVCRNWKPKSRCCMKYVYRNNIITKGLFHLNNGRHLEYKIDEI